MKAICRENGLIWVNWWGGHSSLTTISSEVIENCVENQSDDINGNLNLGVQDNAAHCESPNTDIGIRHTCTQMALAIYQR